MKAVVQRVKQASVTIDGEVVGEIGQGLLVLLGIAAGDDENTIKWFANKLANLRVFEDEARKMNKSLIDVSGEMLVVSNFTIYGDAQKGFRPSFTSAAAPNISEAIYDRFIEYLRENYEVNIQTGQFGAMMDVALINDGPVTLIIEK